MEFEPLYYKNKLRVINPYGHAGIITGWTNPEKVEGELFLKYPYLADQKESPLVAISSFYGTGFNQFFANLAFNPQIYKIAMLGTDIKIFPSYDYLMNFLTKGVIRFENYSQVKETDFPVDSQLNPQHFSYISFKRFGKNYEGLIEFLSEKGDYSLNESDRVKIELKPPKFESRPSDKAYNNLRVKTPLEGWLDVIHTISVFGINVNLPKGERRSLLNLDVNVKNPGFEPEDKLRKYGFEPEKLREYQKAMLDPNLLEGLEYSYGNRGRKYFGLDALDIIGERLRENPLDRNCFLSLWDSSKDLSGENSPCLVSVYFCQHIRDPTLTLSATFRTHNSGSAWLKNLYGLRAWQEFVAEKAGMKPGEIDIRSFYISIDPNSSNTPFILDLMSKKRTKRLDVNDPMGYYTVSVNPGTKQINLKHHSPKGGFLEKFAGKNFKEIQSQLRQVGDFVTFQDHALWIGGMIKEAEFKLNPISPLEDRELLEKAFEIAEKSTCLKEKGGAVIVNSDGKIISTGFYGDANNSGYCEERGCLFDTHGVCRGLPSEQNAICIATRGREPLKSARIFCSSSPDLSSVVFMQNSGIKEIICSKEPKPHIFEYLLKSNMTLKVSIKND